MNDSLKKLLTYIEPKILNIQDKRVEILSLGDSYKTLKEIVDLGQNSYRDILEFYDQDFIIRCIKISNDNYINDLELYKSSKYLLRKNDSNLLELPQYKQAISYMERLFTYLIDLYHQTKLDYDNLKEELEKLEILNKYYLLFTKENFFVDDIEEFILFMQLVDIPEIDKLNLLILVSKFNVKTYTLTNDVIIAPDIYLSDIKSILQNNQEKLDNNLVNDNNLELDNKILFLESGEKSLIEKEKYLITKINNLYKQKEYNRISKYYNSYLEIEDYLNEFEKQKVKYSDNYYKNIIFTKKEDKLLIDDYLTKCSTKYKSCIYKNLLDIETNKELVLPDYKYKDYYFYLKKEFIVKTIYMFLDNGNVLIIGVIDKNADLEKYLEDNFEYIKKTLKLVSKYANNLERDIFLKNIKVEDLVLTIDLDTLDMEE